MNRQIFLAVLVALMVLLLPPAALSESRATKGTSRSLDDKVQALKKEVMQLNRDLFILEEELLFPTSTQIAVFLSVDVGNYFKLDSIELKIDDKTVTHYLYTKQEREALSRGGVQRLYLGNVKKGERELVAVFRGPGPNGREYRRGTKLKFEKGSGTKYIELQITDVSKKLQPEFIVKEWE
ncbi:MAG: AraC family transcriptional regulator [Thiohalomonadales bacterium]